MSAMHTMHTMGAMAMTGDLARLCEHFGIATGYFDAFGARREASAQNLIALLAEFGVHLDRMCPMRAPHSKPHAARAGPRRCRRCRSWMPSARMVAAVAAAAVDAPAPLAAQRRARAGAGRRGRCRVTARDRSQHEVDGVVLCERVLPMPLALETGYHRLRIEGLRGETLVLATHGRCYRPPAVRDGGRVWGTAVQLYSLRSPRNWGIGDFSDLEELAVRMAAQGADIIGLNPLHALFASTPLHTSPYSPSSRQQLNVLYIDVEAVDGFAACTAGPRAGALARLPGAARGLARNAAGGLHRRGRGEIRSARTAVRRLLRAAPARRRARPTTRAGRSMAFVAERGEALRQHALFETLQAHFLATEGGAWDWHAWPHAYRDPDSAEVTAFAIAHAQRVQFHQYLQWLANRQLAHAAARCEALGMGVGLYVDLAVSVDRAGSDAWGAQQGFAEGASVGAPPDEFNPAGQRWGLPPLRPDRLRADGYRFFIETLRASMRGAGALRIDHVMGLMRLFWIPPGRGARDGAYVYYPLDEMLAIVAIESHRHRCMVVGEDLGTVEDAVRDALAKADVLSYRLLYFEKQQGRRIQAARGLSAGRAGCDQHARPGHLRGLVDRERPARAAGARPVPRPRHLRQATDGPRAGAHRADAGLAAGRPAVARRGGAGGRPGHAVARVVEAAHAFLAAAPSALMMVQLEDVAGVVAQANMPGTVDAAPELAAQAAPAGAALAGGERMRGLGEALRAARPRRVAEPARSSSAPAGLQTRVPRATYRLQFHKDFGFDDAIRVLPYLASSA
jgi:(1->4)-alpha-D-glucan 1-alpha-D-glucosylmutase